MKILTAADFLMVPFWLGVIVFVAWRIRRRVYGGDPRGRFLLPGLLLKLFGGMMVGVVYQVYYPSGDTTGYYQTGQAINQAVLEHGLEGTKLLFVDFDTVDETTLTIAYQYSSDITCWNDPKAYFMSSITALFHFVTLQSYFATSLLISSVSFIGMWGLYLVVTDIFPDKYRLFALALFFVPSVFFWGSGILKDSVCLGCLGYIIYQTWRMLRVRRLMSLRWFGILIAGYLIFSIKPYIIIGFVPFQIIWIFLSLYGVYFQGWTFYGFFPIILFLIFTSAFLTLNYLSEFAGGYAVSEIFETALIKQRDLIQSYYYKDQIGSSYLIGEYRGNLASTISLAPQAILTTFFRPLLWEVRNPMMLVVAIENLIVMLFLVRLLARPAQRREIFRPGAGPLLLTFLGFSLSFALMVGIASGNFGNLVRYKIPCVPMFLASMVMLTRLR